MRTDRQLKQAMTSLGVEEIVRNHHVKWRLPNGQLLVTSGSPSDRRALRNVARDLIRAGMDRQRVREAFGL